MIEVEKADLSCAVNQILRSNSYLVVLGIKNLLGKGTGHVAVINRL